MKPNFKSLAQPPFHLFKKIKASYLLAGICSMMLFTAMNTHAATYIVSNTNNSGAGSLRQAIIDANATAAVTDNIHFNIAGAGPHTITILTPLPQITSPVHISGYILQTGASMGTISGRSIRIQINAGNFPDGNNGIIHFQAGASGSSLSGVAIYNTGSLVAAVALNQSSSDIHIWGNYFGLLANGDLPAAGGELKGDIITLEHDDVTTTTISNISIGTNGDGANDANEGNVIGNSTTNINGGEGINLSGGAVNRINANNIKIAGNYIGLRPDGSSAAALGSNTPIGGTYDSGLGIDIRNMNGNNFVIGSNGDGVSDALERNVIANCSQYGIYLQNCNNINIAGNYVGTDATGTLSRPNSTESPSWTAILVTKTNTNTFSDNIVIGFDDSKHTTAVAPFVRNIISGNNGAGIWLNTANSSGSTARLQNVVVAGNYIGVDVTGNVALPNGQFGATTAMYLGAGIGIINAINNRIGTDSDGDDDALERNVISGNINGDGIFLSSGFFASDGNIVAGNYIGVGANGTTPLGNGHSGVFLSNINGINNNRIGSNDDGVRDAVEANIIANNGVNTNTAYKSGISFARQAGATGTAFGNRFSRNIYYNNAALSIDLMSDATTVGVTPNDGVTTAGEANLLLDYPVITGYKLTGNVMAVSGYVSICNGNEMTAGAAIAGVKRIQFYKVANDGNQDGAITGGACSRIAAHGEGVEYLGSITDVVNGFNTSFTLVAGATFNPGDQITAIAIDANGNTSEFGVTTITNALPVTFGGVMAVWVNGNLQVNWSTLSETNNSHFEIEASTDGKNFVQVGKVNSKAENGNASVPLNYDFTANADTAGLAAAMGLLLLGAMGTGPSGKRKWLLCAILYTGIVFGMVACTKQDKDAVAHDGDLFVRIAQVDKDGTKSYSDVVRVVRK